MYYAKVGCADTFENRQLQSSARLTSAPLFFLCRVLGGGDGGVEGRGGEAEEKNRSVCYRWRATGQQAQLRKSKDGSVAFLLNEVAPRICTNTVAYKEPETYVSNLYKSFPR